MLDNAGMSTILSTDTLRGSVFSRCFHFPPRSNIVGTVAKESLVVSIFLERHEFSMISVDVPLGRASTPIAVSTNRCGTLW